MHTTFEQALTWIGQLDAQARHITTPIEGGGIMHWRTFGSGTPLVLLHGGHGNWLHWVENIAELAAAHEVWIPDLPGFGESDLAHPAQSLDALNAAVASGLDRLLGPQTPIGLAAFSFGTRVASTLAALRPVSKLALLGAAGHGANRRPYPAMRNWRRLDTAAARRAAFAHNVAAFMLHDLDALGPLAVAAYELSCINTRFRSKNLSIPFSLADALQCVTCPVLLAWGNDDVTLDDPALVAHNLALRKPGTVWEIVPDAGHWVQFEKAHQVNDLLLCWFR